MNHNEPNEAVKRIVREFFAKMLKNVNYNDVEVSSDSDDNLIIRYNGTVLKIPIGKPDQETTNNIWTFLAGGVVAIGGVLVGARICRGK